MQEARDLQIAADYARGHTLRTLGSKYGLTSERVRQILTRRGNGTRPPGPRPTRARRRPRSLQDRFFAHVDVHIDKEGNEHWVWKKTAAHGYGAFKLGGSLEYAHRAAFYLIRGRRPTRLRKLCTVQGCVNPVCWTEWSSDESKGEKMALAA